LVLADAADNPIEPHVDRFSILRAGGFGRKSDGAFVITPDDRRGLGVTEGVGDFAFVDTHLGVGEEASTLSEYSISPVQVGNYRHVRIRKGMERGRGIVRELDNSCSSNPSFFIWSIILQKLL
jgi:hypothetical protein